MIDLSKEKFCIWGFHNPPYDTFKHIHEAFYRALKYSGKKVLWLDAKDDTSQIDFSDTFFITMNIVVGREINSIPLRRDCYYAVHNNIQTGRERFEGLDFLPYGVQLAGKPDHEPGYTSVNMPWATDLLPHEIEANKPSKIFKSDSKVVNYVGTIWEANRRETADFDRACGENGILFRQIRGGVSIEENVRLIKESYLAPAIIGSGHPVGYIPCRAMKNLSYGSYPITNSSYINDFFDGRLIYNPDPYKLFFDAREQLSYIPLRTLHSLMDYVSENHTYLNRIERLLEGARFRLENK
jgi:hypothetical protein